MRRADLHAHSNASDGTLSPADLVDHAARSGVTLLAVTDHDTVEGLERAVDAGRRRGIRVVPGIEISARHDGASVHVLGYLPSTRPRDLLGQIDEIAGDRERRNREILDRLADLGVPVSWQAVQRHVSGRMARPHIARAMVDAGHVASVQEAFDRFLDDDAPAYVMAGALDAIEAVTFLHRAGAVSSIAHPFQIRLAWAAVEELIAELAGAGLNAIEAHRGDHTDEDRDQLISLAGRLGLETSGGSDYHGPDLEHRDRVLGRTGTPGLSVAQAEALVERIGLRNASRG